MVVYFGYSLLAVIALAGKGIIAQSQCANQDCAVFDGKLEMDTAFVNITTPVDQPITVMGISSNCYKCPLQTLHQTMASHDFVIVHTHYKFIFVINNATTDDQLCRLDYLFGEGGWYEYALKLDAEGQATCSLTAIKEPKNPYKPILYAFYALLALAVLWIIYSKLKERCGVLCCGGSHDITTEGSYSQSTSGTMEVRLEDGSFPRNLSSKENSVNVSQVELTEMPKEKKRLKSLDTFRGIAITVMIFVNFGGGGYYFFEHAVWNGLLLADLVFPWFIWIMGVSITLSFKSLKRRKVKKSKISLKIIRRSLVLFGLGIFTSNFNDLEYYRIPGVLQRFAACYFVIALMQLFISPTEEQPQKRWWDPIRDVVSLWKQWLLMFIVLGVFLVVTYAIQVDGCPRGYTGPGGIGDGYPLAANCTGGVANYIDRNFFGKHIYRWPTIKGLYKTTLPHDPEGFLGTLTSIILVFFGVQAGRILHTYHKHSQRIGRWLAWGVVLGLIGIGLCGGTKNDGLIPINKNLWSVSFIMVTGATSFVLLAFCYAVTDALDWWNGAPFYYPGMNSILLYVAHGILYNNFPFSWKMDKYGTHAEKLSMNLAGTTLWLLISYYLFKKKVFLKV